MSDIGVRDNLPCTCGHYLNAHDMSGYPHDIGACETTTGPCSCRDYRGDVATVVYGGAVKYLDFARGLGELRTGVDDDAHAFASWCVDYYGDEELRFVNYKVAYETWSEEQTFARL